MNVSNTEVMIYIHRNYDLGDIFLKLNITAWSDSKVYQKYIFDDVNTVTLKWFLHNRINFNYSHRMWDNISCHTKEEYIDFLQLFLSTGYNIKIACRHLERLVQCATPCELENILKTIEIVTDQKYLN